MALRLSTEQYEKLQKRARKPATRIETPAPSKSHLKYQNRPTGGYASVKEARRAQELKLLLEAGQIRNLREQVEYELIPKQDGERACKYVADFVYEEHGYYESINGETFLDWHEVTEDVKSPASRTPEYIIKRKLMLQRYGIRIRET